MANDKCDGVGADGPALPDGVQAFAPLRLNADLLGRYTERPSELALHSRDVGAQLGAFESNSGIDVHNLVTSVLDVLPHASHEDKARSFMPLGRMVGKVLAQVAQREGTQQSVADGVGQGVTVRVAHRAFLKRDSHPTQNERAPRRQGVNVVSDADATGRRCEKMG